jgi:hypothetical protein
MVDTGGAIAPGASFGQLSGVRWLGLGDAVLRNLLVGANLQRKGMLFARIGVEWDKAFTQN